MGWVDSPLLPVFQRCCRLYLLHHGSSWMCPSFILFLSYLSSSSPADYLNENGKDFNFTPGRTGVYSPLLNLNLRSTAVLIGFIDTDASAGDTADDPVVAAVCISTLLFSGHCLMVSRSEIHKVAVAYSQAEKR